MKTKINFGSIGGYRLIYFAPQPFRSHRYQQFLYRKAAWKAWKTRRAKALQQELPLQ